MEKITTERKRRDAARIIQAIKTFNPKKLEDTYMQVIEDRRKELTKHFRKMFPRAGESYINDKVKVEMPAFLPWSFYIPSPEVAPIHVVCLYYDELLKHKDSMTRDDDSWLFSVHGEEWKQRVEAVCQMAKFLIDQGCSPWLEMCPEIKRHTRHGKSIYVKQGAKTISERFKRLPPAVKERIDSHVEKSYEFGERRGVGELLDVA